jgi:hypothetical protein
MRSCATFDLQQAPDANLDPDIAFRFPPMWRSSCVALLGVALAQEPLRRPLSGYRRSARAVGKPLSAFGTRLTAPIRRDEIQQRNWVCRTGAAVVTATVITAAVVTAVVVAGVRMAARVESAACVETAASVKAAAAGADSARMTAAPAPREHGRSSDRNNHGDRCN